MPVIVSASYRTDIPAFYARWFLARLEAGYARVANPYGGGSYEVSLRPGDVGGFVFWTRNMRPLMAARTGVTALSSHLFYRAVHRNRLSAFAGKLGDRG